MSEILSELEKTDKISEYLTDVGKMIELVDSFIYNSNNPKVKEIINKIETRKLQSIVFEKISLKEFSFPKEVFNKFNESSYKIVKYKVGYTSGKNPNPLSSIKFYRPKNNMIIPDITIQNFSLLTNENHQEYVYRVYCIDDKIRDDLYHSLN